MKKLLLLFVAALTLASCDTNDDYSNFYYEYVPTEEADVPAEMEIGKIYRIHVDYIAPTTCYQYVNLDYNKSIEDIDDLDGNPIETNIRTIGIVNRVFEDDACEVSDATKQVFFDFEPRAEGPYVFRFWVGEDEEGENIYLEYETEVISHID
ncbi:conserved hypothetical protein [Formosa agariphila KMM 3901]|uniref:Lipoprotein n=1 Tax=Formosa agariphila (strain DSM 15362 / KCTC 12365 / LMG 23005 / KMM 3901 / M-2Alg 35-1) TaxID=1347342 RepID=T2KSC3_FORAG|nr:membrane lipoprotein lipid attachment site-containing protein [Formosa agariphila]CDF81169.1 conserved hypothetical protein [Formosa agariphila KMM 3901]